MELRLFSGVLRICVQMGVFYTVFPLRICLMRPEDTAPSRRITGGSTVTSTMVEAAFPAVAPPSTMRSIRSPIRSMTSAAELHSASPETLALVDVKAPSRLLAREEATVWLDRRKPILPVPPVSRRFTRAAAEKMSVRGPGHRALISGVAALGISAA